MATVTHMPLLSAIVFTILSAALLALVLVVVRSSNIFHSAVALTGALAIVAAVFAFLGADFVAASQLLIYVGGVMVIMLFVIILFQQSAGSNAPQTNEQWLTGFFAAGTVIGVLVCAFWGAYSKITTAHEPGPTTAALGRLLLGDLAVPFEVVSLVLLAALIGAAAFGTERPGDHR
jgi:NADH-quinone oxidoreductase subunit J